MYLSRKAISPQLHSLFAALATCASASPAMLRPQSMSMDPPCSEHACSRPNISIWKGLKSFADLKAPRSEEHTSELQSLMRNSYAVFCLNKKSSKKHSHKRKTTNKHKQTSRNHYTSYTKK